MAIFPALQKLTHMRPTVLAKIIVKTPRRMLIKDLLIAKINGWNNSSQNMYDMM